MEEAERREGDKRRNYPHENEEVEKDREREMKERERERVRCSGERWHAGTTSPVPGSFRQHFRLSCGSTIGAGSKHDADRVRSTERAR